MPTDSRRRQTLRDKNEAARFSPKRREEIADALGISVKRDSSIIDRIDLLLRTYIGGARRVRRLESIETQKQALESLQRGLKKVLYGAVVTGERGRKLARAWGACRFKGENIDRECRVKQQTKIGREQLAAFRKMATELNKISEELVAEMKTPDGRPQDPMVNLLVELAKIWYEVHNEEIPYSDPPSPGNVDQQQKQGRYFIDLVMSGLAEPPAPQILNTKFRSATRIDRARRKAGLKSEGIENDSDQDFYNEGE